MDNQPKSNEEAILNEFADLPFGSIWGMTQHEVITMRLLWLLNTKDRQHEEALRERDERINGLMANLGTSRIAKDDVIEHLEAQLAQKDAEIAKIGEKIQEEHAVWRERQKKFEKVMLAAAAALISLPDAFNYAWEELSDEEQEGVKLCRQMLVESIKLFNE